MSSLTETVVNNLLFSYGQINSIASFLIFYFNLMLILFICGVPMLVAKSIYNICKVIVIHMYKNFDLKVNRFLDKKGSIFASYKKPRIDYTK